MSIAQTDVIRSEVPTILGENVLTNCASDFCVVVNIMDISDVLIYLRMLH